MTIVSVIGMGFVHIPFIHDIICELIHRYRHQKRFHGDKRCLMTLNTIFSIVWNGPWLDAHLFEMGP